MYETFYTTNLAVWYRILICGGWTCSICAVRTNITTKVWVDSWSSEITSKVYKCITLYKVYKYNSIHMMHVSANGQIQIVTTKRLQRLTYADWLNVISLLMK